jgi:hypothetical protein
MLLRAFVIFSNMLNSLSKTWEEIAKGLLEEVEKNLSDARHELKNGEESVRRAAEDLAIATTTAEETAEAEE